MEQKDPTKICLRCGAKMEQIVNETGYRQYRCTEGTCKNLFNKILIDESEEQSNKKIAVRCGSCGESKDLRMLTNEGAVREFVCESCHALTRTINIKFKPDKEDFIEIKGERNDGT